jgi:chemotaxis-related protein WspD
MIENCWHTIGIEGDASCQLLGEHVHCRNCPTYARAANAIMQDALPLDDLDERTAHVARPAADSARGELSVFVFRLGREWLSLPSDVIDEVAEPGVVHALPHRRREILLGIASLGGELLPAVSLAALVGATAGAPTAARTHTAQARRLVFHRDALRVLVPVDEVYGMHPLRRADLRDVPGTLSAGAAAHATGLFLWREHTVGLLDPARVFDALVRSLG